MKDTSFSRIVAVLTSPARTYRSIAERPTWLVPILVLMVLAVVTTYIAAPKIDWQETLATKLERADREVAPEEIETVLGFMQDYGEGLLIGRAVVMPWIICPLLALIFLKLFEKMGCDLSFRTSLGVVAHGFMPWAVASVLGLSTLLASASLNLYRPGPMTLSPAAFASDQTSLELWVLLNSINPFSLWTAALLVIGFSVAARVSKGRAAACVLGAWAAWIVFTVAMAALD